MTERLREKLKTYLIQRGALAAKAELSLATRKSTRMIERYIDGTSNPSQDTSYRLARQCGCSEEEALVLAGAPQKRARTA